jgi:HlyD family secretion protein
MAPSRLIRALRPVRRLRARQVLGWLGRGLAGAAVIAIGAAAAIAVRLWPAGPAADVPTITVARGPFVRRVTAEGNLRAVNATPVMIARLDGFAAVKLAWLAPDGSPVKTGDVVARFDGVEATRQLREAEADVESTGVALRKERLRAAASDARSRDQATLARQHAEHTRRYQATDPLLFTRNEISEAEIEERLASARRAQAEFAREVNRGLAASDIALAELARQRAAVALDHARTALARLELRAPGDGVFVIRRDDHGDIPHLGAQLSFDAPIGDIPVLDEMEAELFVLEADGSGLDAGQAADVVVESTPDTVFHGKVRMVDKLARPREPGVLQQSFAAVVAFDHTDRAVMKPGQRVRGTLVLDRRDAIVVPRQAVVERAGATVVYRRTGHGFAPVPVEIATAMPGRVAIVAGLADGDVIAARDPTRTADPEPRDQPEAGTGAAAHPAKGSP